MRSGGHIIQKRVECVEMDWDGMWSMVGTHWPKKNQNIESLANEFGDNHQFKMIVQHIRDLSDMVQVEAAKDEQALRFFICCLAFR